MDLCETHEAVSFRNVLRADSKDEVSAQLWICLPTPTVVHGTSSDGTALLNHLRNKAMSIAAVRRMPLKFDSLDR